MKENCHTGYEILPPDADESISNADLVELRGLENSTEIVSAGGLGGSKSSKKNDAIEKLMASIDKKNNILQSLVTESQETEALKQDLDELKKTVGSIQTAQAEAKDMLAKILEKLNK
ncbi:hypothetical protein ENBRE01_2816 [Enteropsectra breve]|nr:hypothetical protein ENBRE01_2816 [Enteropsectra breve]